MIWESADQKYFDKKLTFFFLFGYSIFTDICLIWLYISKYLYILGFQIFGLNVPDEGKSRKAPQKNHKVCFYFETLL